MIPLFGIDRQRDYVKGHVVQRISAIFNDSQYILGPQVEELESKLAQYTGGHVVTVSSGRDALFMALRALDIKGDVAVPAFTFPATAEVVYNAGCTPVFVDIDPDTWTMCPADLEKNLRLNPRIKAVIPVDIFGLPADYRSIRQVCDQYGDMRIVSDAAQSFPHLSGRSELTCYSFYPTKPLGCYGDGGAIVTPFQEIADNLKLIRSNGVKADGIQHDCRGMTGRLDTMQAAVLLAKLEVFDDEMARRKAIAARYDRCLPFKGQTLGNGKTSSHAIYAIRVPHRKIMMERLKEAGIESKVYYPAPLNRHPAFSVFSTGICPEAEKLCNEVLAIPMHPYLDEREIEWIIEVISGPR